MIKIQTRKNERKMEIDKPILETEEENRKAKFGEVNKICDTFGLGGKYYMPSGRSAAVLVRTFWP